MTGTRCARDSPCHPISSPSTLRQLGHAFVRRALDIISIARLPSDKRTALTRRQVDKYSQQQLAAGDFDAPASTIARDRVQLSVFFRSVTR